MDDGRGATGIVLFDGMYQKPDKHIPQGNIIFQALWERYGGGDRSVKVYYGVESLETTVRLFRGCRYFISLQDSLETAMLFMPAGGSVIEVKPWDTDGIDLFSSVANAIGLNHYAQPTTTPQMGPVYVDMAAFLTRVFYLIDNHL